MSQKNKEAYSLPLNIFFCSLALRVVLATGFKKKF